MNCLLLVLLGILSLAVTDRSYGQDTNASLSGTVVDPSNAIVPGANLTLTNEATAYQQKATSNSAGEYTFRNLTPGKYDIFASAKGFEGSAQKGIELAVNQAARVDVHLKVGQADETVTVIGDASLINYETPTLEGGVSPETLQDMPLTVSGQPRTAIGLAVLMPGVSTGSSDNAYNARINGGLVSGDEAVLDGVTMEEGYDSQSGMVSLYGDFQMSPDMVSEVHVLTANYEAQYGNTTSGQLIVQSKGGGEQFHGAGFEYNRNDLFNGFQYGTSTYVPDANGNPTNVKTRKAADKENNYGANIGGPVYLPGLHGANSKRKAYFFFNWEAYFQHGAAVVAPLTIPSVNARVGNFSNYTDTSGNLIPIFYPVVKDPTNPLHKYSGQQIPGNIIDPTIWAAVEDPISAAWTAVAPTPTSGGEINNYIPSNGGQGSLVNAENVYMTREDFILGSSDHFYLTYWRQYAQPNLNSALPDAISTAIPASPENAPVSRMNWEHTFSSVLTNHASFGYLNRNEGYSSLNYKAGANLPKVAGVADNDLPAFNLNESLMAFGNNYGAPGHEYTTRPTWAFNDVLTFVKGKHTLTFGYEWKNLGGNIQNSYNQGGSFSFDRSTTAVSTEVSGDDMASWFLGAASSASVYYYTVGATYPRQFGSAAHAGDSWRFTPKLTVTYGLRWDYDAPFEEKQNNLSFFDPNGVNTGACNGGSCLKGSLAFAGSSRGAASFGARYPEKLDLDNFSPRLGIAYSLNDKTVIHVGYGIYFGQAFYPGWNAGMNLDGFNLQDVANQVSYENASEPTVFLSHNGFTPFSAGADKPITSITSGADNGLSPMYRPQDANHRPYSSQWNLTVERELPHNFFFSASYVGTKGTHLPSQKSPINVLNPYSGQYKQLASTPFQTYSKNQLTTVDTVLKADYNSTVTTDGDGLEGYDGPTVFAAAGIATPYADWNGQLNTAGTCPATVAQALVPYPQYCGVEQGLNEEHGNSIYNSFQARIERHMTHGLYVLGSMTISKMYTDATETTQAAQDTGGGQTAFSPYNIKPLMELAEDNTPIIGSLALVYDFPIGHGQQFLNSGKVSSVATGWKLAPITRYEYGVPFTFTSASCNVVSQVREACLPGIVPGQQLLLHGRNGFDPTKNNGQYINPSALEPASSFSGAYGYLGTGRSVTSTYGPDLKDTDLSLIKETKFHDRVSFVFTANFFNAFNNHYFVNTGQQTVVSSAFNTSVGGTGFGQWNGTVSSPRTVQFSGRLEF